MSNDPARNTGNQDGRWQPSRFDDPKQKRKLVRWIIIPVVAILIW